jgi:asparagine N-glycosylation enzyme membrane subunit Stt3
MPFLWMAREATRFIYLMQFALSVLAAFGLKSLLEAYSEPHRWKPVLVIAKWTAISTTAILFALGLFSIRILILGSVFQPISSIFGLVFQALSSVLAGF